MRECQLSILLPSTGTGTYVSDDPKEPTSIQSQVSRYRLVACQWAFRIKTEDSAVELDNFAVEVSNSRLR